MEEQELATRCAKQDNEARRELYELHSPRILSLCRRYAVDSSEAEDLMQDAFVKIFRVMNKFRWAGPGSHYSWMSRVALNLAFDSAKRRRRLSRQFPDAETIPEDIPEEPDYDSAASVPPKVLHSMIEALPERYRIVFQLYCIDELSHREIANLLGIKEKSSSANLSRARALLASAICQYKRSHAEDDDSVTDETAPSPESWPKIGQKMRRAAAWRRTGFAAIVLTPIAAILVWVLWINTSAPAVKEDIPAILLGSDTYVSEDSPIGNDDLFFVPQSIPVVSRRSSLIVQADSGSSSVLPDEAATDPDLEPDTDVPQDDSPAESEKSVDPKADEKSPAVSVDPFKIVPEPAERFRPNLSIGLGAGSGTERRQSGFKLRSTPYVAALTYMNSFELPNPTRVKSNYSNTAGYGEEANRFFPESSTGKYSHDLPISLGVTIRAGLTPILGAESGIDYTYLHSAFESATGRIDQHLHFIGIPLRMDVRLLSRGGFGLYTGLGVKAEKCIAASFGQIRCEEKRLQWSAGAFAGVQYGIWHNVYLFVQPEVSYYFTETDLVTYRTENPFSFTIHGGLRLDL
ncbi:MAG: sigma-70 family RNA polymerase sigma factor [Bacteroidales bacterium]|nr:sigma-70 family RNA polymerase sigma factor [Bacteroidales bacterium]